MSWYNRRVRDPRIALGMLVLGIGNTVVSQTLMWTPSEESATGPVTPEGIPILRLGGEPEPELPSPLLVASTAAGLILAAGGVGAFLLARADAHERPALARPTSFPPAPVAPAGSPRARLGASDGDPLAADPELRALVEQHEARRGR